MEYAGLYFEVSVGILPISLSFEHAGIALYCFGSYSVFLSTQDWRTYTFWTEQNETIVNSLYTHYTHAALHSSFVPWRDSIIIIINNKKHNFVPVVLATLFLRVLEDPWAHCFWLLTPTPKW